MARNMNNTASVKNIEKISWLKPPVGALKMNVNSSFSRREQTSGIGGILRDSEGKLYFAFTEPVDTKTYTQSALSEYRAVERAIQMTLTQKYVNVIFETDSFEVYDKVQKALSFRKPRAGNQLKRTCLWNIVKMLQSSPNYSVVHTVGEGNVAADFLAKRAYDTQQYRMYYTVSDAGSGIYGQIFKGFLLHDKFGMTTIREKKEEKTREKEEEDT